jgi:hypothetical protein
MSVQLTQILFQKGKVSMNHDNDKFIMELVLNEEKIDKDYDLFSYKYCVNSFFNSFGLVKEDDGLYYSDKKGTASDFARFGAAILGFERLDWVKLDYIDRWVWYERRSGENRYVGEDVIASINRSIKREKEIEQKKARRKSNVFGFGKRVKA